MSKMTFDHTINFSVELNNFTINKEALKKINWPMQLRRSEISVCCTSQTT